MVAEMNTLVESFSNEDAKKELKKFQKKIFKPTTKSCYEQLYALPAIDEIDLDINKVSLVIFEPYPGSKLHPELEAFL